MPRTASTVVLTLALIVTSVFVTGCSKNQPIVPDCQILDRARLLVAADKAVIARVAADIRGLVASRVSIVTVPSIDAPYLAGYGDDAFHAAPVFESFFGEPVPEGVDASASHGLWQPRGILVLACLKPRLVVLRVGSDYRNIVDDAALHELLEVDVYPLLLKGRVREATVGALRAIAARIRSKPAAVAETGRFRGMVNGFLTKMREYSFPTWTLYQWLFGALLNSMVFVMRQFDWSVWGIVAWLVILHLLTADVVLTRGLAHLLSGGEPLKPWSLPVADLVIRLLKLGLGLPVWACLSLVTLPNWENVLTMRQYLWGWLSSGLDSHRLFALQHGLLWWDKPTTSAGPLFALVFAFFYLFNARAKIIDLAKRAGDEGANQEALVQYLLTPFAVSLLPFVLALYLLLWEISNWPRSLMAMFSRDLPPPGRPPSPEPHDPGLASQPGGKTSLPMRGTR